MYLIEQSELDRYADQFTNCTLPVSEWTHEMHLIMALNTLVYHKEKPLEIMRTKIKKYNESIGKQNSDTQGYHETLTIFWLNAVNEFCQSLTTFSYDESTVDELLFNENLANRNLFLKYYTLDNILSTQARKEYVKPDLTHFYS
jgi:hypothetical protein